MYSSETQAALLSKVEFWIHSLKEWYHYLMTAVQQLLHHMIVPQASADLTGANGGQKVPMAFQ